MGSDANETLRIPDGSGAQAHRLVAAFLSGLGLEMGRKGSGYNGGFRAEYTVLNSLHLVIFERNGAPAGSISIHMKPAEEKVAFITVEKAPSIANTFISNIKYMLKTHAENRFRSGTGSQDPWKGKTPPPLRLH